MVNHSHPEIGVVAIGRNEGGRLKRCLASVVGKVAAVVYVDSGSTDNSVEYARSLGVEVVELDTDTPFTAARARNAGWQRLIEVAPGVLYIQFADGDAEILDGWLDAAKAHLQKHPELAACFGRRRERYPEASRYNQLCELEWNTPPGRDTHFGGELLMRVEALQQVGGYDPTVPAAEDDELAIRLKDAGWELERIDRDMSLHDADMHRFGQWWRRMVRTGHCYAQGRDMHGDGPQHHFVSQYRRTLLWGVLYPGALLLLALPTLGLSLLGFVAYVLPARGAYRYGKSRGWPAEALPTYAAACAISRFPEGLGLLKYHWRKWRRRPMTLIEYKGPAELADDAAKPRAA